MLHGWHVLSTSTVILTLLMEAAKFLQKTELSEDLFLLSS